MLDLAGLPVRSADRQSLTPLVMAGGTACINPEPMAPFVDLFAIGEGETMDIDVVNLLRQAKKEGWDKTRFLREAAQIDGIYVPSLYEYQYNDDGTIKSITALEGTPQTVTKRIVENLDEAVYPAKTIVPSTEIVQDKVSLELFRGCIRGCRFCQAGYAYRPVRRRSPEKLAQLARQALEDSGYEEVTLLSLSSSDYKGLDWLCDDLMCWCEPRKISLSLPSLRADNFSMNLMEKVQKVRRSGLTFAPEAGSQRLRDVINKNVTDEDIINSCRVAFEGGWSTLKLYFMLGLPTETDEDVLAIAKLTDIIVGTWRKYATNKLKGLRITVSTSCFIPKPHTPFQWEKQVTREEYLRRVNLLRANIKAKAVTYNWHDAETSLVEAALSRGDRRSADAVEAAWKDGARLDSWSEYFSFDRWEKAFRENTPGLSFYACRERALDEVLPWDVISVGVKKSFLCHEREQAYNAQISPDCRVQCTGCGASELIPGRRCDE